MRRLLRLVFDGSVYTATFGGAHDYDIFATTSLHRLWQVALFLTVDDSQHHSEMEKVLHQLQASMGISGKQPFRWESVPPMPRGSTRRIAKAAR
jgi:hypothetical protein